MKIQTVKFEDFKFTLKNHIREWFIIDLIRQRQFQQFQLNFMSHQPKPKRKKNLLCPQSGPSYPASHWQRPKIHWPRPLHPLGQFLVNSCETLSTNETS